MSFMNKNDGKVNFMNGNYGGYTGHILRINLSTREIDEYSWSDKDRRLYLGGKIMAAKILFDNLSSDTKPFSEENMLVITTGPLTGTGCPSSSRFNISTLSPLTGFVASSNCGGNFGYQLKKAGYDGLILYGKSQDQIWIEITETNVVFHNANELWGKTTGECQKLLSERSGKICIGPAGENLVRYASIMSGERAAGRAGVGAIMGWKNVKAVTAIGSKNVDLHQQSKLKVHNRKWIEYLKKHPLTGVQLPNLGTAGLISSMNANHLLATKNYKYGQYKDFDLVSGETLAEKFLVKNKGCITCPIKCARVVSIDEREVKGPELETLGLLGANILNNNLELILKWNYQLDELGMDTISAASTLAFAMELDERGLWNSGLSFGKTENISQTFEDIAYRRGIGDLLAEGSRVLSKKYGGQEFAIHSKGLELAAYEPRAAVGQGLGYAVSNRGGCHLNGGYMVILEGLGLSTNPLTTYGKADLTMMFQDVMEAISAGGNCLFTSYAMFPAILIKRPNGLLTRTINAIIPFSGPLIRLTNKFPLFFMPFHLPVLHHTKAIKLATGMKMSFGEYMKIGERGYNLERLCNTKFGIGSKDDSLPKRLTEEVQILDNKNTKVPLERMKKTYYSARGWDNNGIPTKTTLRKLELI